MQYLAYGSNLNIEGMQRRCPDAQMIDWLWLSDTRLVFRGVADLEYSPGDMVPVGLWDISKEDERTLDQYEGVASGLYSKFIISIGDAGEALIYLMNDRGIAPPSAHYANTIREGYDAFGFDHAFLDAAIARAWKRKDHSDETRRRAKRDRKWKRRTVPMPDWVAVAVRDKVLLKEQQARLDEARDLFDDLFDEQFDKAS